MDKIEERIKRIKTEGRIGLMTHVVVGYPALEDTVALVKLMAQSGVDFVELQIPFSDPLADGPTIMRACEQSLENGIKVKDAFEIMRTLSREVEIPLLFMSYYNTVFHFGTEKFCKDAQKAGACGLIVPDMPIEEEGSEHFMQYCKKYELHDIHVISPASTPDRLEKNAHVASGFIYCTARQGITGVRGDLSLDLSNYLKKVRETFSIPLAVGFGISKKEHLKALEGKADIAVVGSALIDVINRADKKKRLLEVGRFIEELKV